MDDVCMLHGAAYRRLGGGRSEERLAAIHAGDPERLFAGTGQRFRRAILSEQQGALAKPRTWGPTRGGG